MSPDQAIEFLIRVACGVAFLAAGRPIAPESVNRIKVNLDACQLGFKNGAPVPLG
jgi:hypothetical protein